MAAITSNIINGTNVGLTKDGVNINIVKTLFIETANTVDAADTIAITYAEHGITTVIGVLGFKHTTDNSVIVTENPTTSVTSSVMTITVPAGSNDDKRIYQLFYT